MNQLENLCVEVRKPHSKPLIVATWYRIPDFHAEIFAHFESLISRLDSQSESVEFYLMRNLNCNSASTLDTNKSLLTSIADVYGFHQLINEPTRITNLTSTLIDVAFTNCPGKIVCSGVSHVSISDNKM